MGLRRLAAPPLLSCSPTRKIHRLRQHLLLLSCDILVGGGDAAKVKLFLLKKDYIYLFLEKGKEGERDGETHQCVLASHAPPTGDLA